MQSWHGEVYRNKWTQPRHLSCYFSPFFACRPYQWCQNTRGRAAVSYVSHILNKERSQKTPHSRHSCWQYTQGCIATGEPGNHKLDFHSAFSTHNHAFWFSTLPHSHPQPITPHAMPSSPNAGCHLNSDHKHNSWGKGKQKPQRHHRALLNICKQPVQESQPIPAPSIKAAAAPLSIFSHGSFPVVPAPSRTLPGGGRKMRGWSRQVVDVGEAPGRRRQTRELWDVCTGQGFPEQLSCFLRLHWK